MERQMQIPLDPKEVKELRAGDYVKLSGIIYTARDAAHKRMSEALERGEKLPIDIEGAVIYYMGPSPARKGVPLDRQDLPPQAEWINIHRDYWILAWQV